MYSTTEKCSCAQVLVAAEMNRSLKEIEREAIRGASKMMRDAQPKDDYSLPENDILAELGWVIKRPTPCDHLENYYYKYYFYFYEYCFHYFHDCYRAAIYGA